MEQPIKWNDGKCMSFVINKTSENRRCELKVKTNDFCHMHIKKNQYYDKLLKQNRDNIIKNLNINKKKLLNDITKIVEEHEIVNIVTNIKKRNNILDNKYDYTLMNMYNSWNDINFSNQVLIDNEYWNINIFIDTITHQLNNSTMENPYPSYPNNPFNRKPFTPKSLLSICDVLKQLKKPINITLKMLLSQTEKFIRTLYDEVKDNHDSRFSSGLLILFKKHFRFMIINSKNSQNSYVGIWTHKSFPLTDFEVMYNTFKNMPYQIVHYGHIVNNPHREILQHRLEYFKQNIFDVNDFCELI